MKPTPNSEEKVVSENQESTTKGRRSFEWKSEKIDKSLSSIAFNFKGFQFLSRLFILLPKNFCSTI